MIERENHGPRITDRNPNEGYRLKFNAEIYQNQQDLEKRFTFLGTGWDHDGVGPRLNKQILNKHWIKEK